MTSKIGLVGLGLVGTAIAGRLLAEQFNVIGFDIKPARCEHLEKLGGKAVDNPAQVAEQTDRIILSVPNTEVVLKIVEGPEGILESKTLPKYIIDTVHRSCLKGKIDEMVTLNYIGLLKEKLLSDKLEGLK